MTQTPSLLEFPCEVPIKVFGRNEPMFRDHVIAIVSRHYAEHAVAERTSGKGSYSSLTITVRASTREELDAVYHELVASEQILMVL
jgi:putative lipoic acid-binding regulatory protein